MKRLSIATCVVLCSLAVLPLIAACGGGTPEERVAKVRAMYKARINGFIVQKPEPEEPALEMAEGEEEAVAASAEAAAVEAEGGEEGMMAEEMEEMAPAPNPDILLDILIQHDSPEILPGITVDISMADGDGNPKDAWKVYFDTSTVRKANITPYTHVLEDVEYEDGDGFFAEIRHPIPAEEQGEYREFSEAG